MTADTTLFRKIEKANLRIDTLVAELDRVKELCSRYEQENTTLKCSLTEALSLLKHAECGPSAYVDITMRGDWKTRKDKLVASI